MSSYIKFLIVSPIVMNMDFIKPAYIPCNVPCNSKAQLLCIFT